MSNQRNTKAPMQPLSSVSNQTRKKVNVQSTSNIIDIDDNINTKSVICDDFNKELLKHEINIGKYFNKDGTNLCDDTILKRLSIEYQKAIRVKNIETIVLIKNELMNHMPEQMFIHNFFMGEVYNQNKQQLNAISQDIVEVSNEYKEVYQNAKQIID